VNQPPVILLHGIMGSRLEDAASGEEVWFGSLSRLVFSDYREVALEIDPVSLDPMPSKLAPSGLADQLAGKDFYGNITRTLERAGRYERALPGEAQEPGSRSYYVFLYDWRQDNAKSAQQLYRFIEQIRKDYSNPQLEVDLIAHSMGGLIARYFLRYGKTDVLRDNTFEVNLDGADRVRRVILLGTPNLGSMSSLHAFIKGKKIGFGGDCLLTPARLLVEEVRGVSEVRLWPHEISDPLPGVDYDSLMLEPGDGIVTKASLLARESLDSSVTRHRYIDFPLDYPLFLCEKHDALTGNETFQDNLLHALLSLEPSR
jgi:pimeloyl-ACP methyl ester carboxylesterase